MASIRLTLLLTNIAIHENHKDKIPLSAKIFLFHSVLYLIDGLIKLANNQPEGTAGGSIISRQSASSPGLNSSGTGVRRPSSSGGPGSRPATPTGRPSLTTASKPSRSSTPTSRASLPPSKPTVSATRSSSSTSSRPTAPARSSTPTRSTASSVKSTVTARSSTPTRSTARSSTPTRSTARSSTPTERPSIPPPSRSAPRASTPTLRPSTPSNAAPSISSAPPIKSLAAVTKSSPTTTARNPVASRGSSPAPKSRPWNPSDMPGYSLDAPPNLRTSLSDRPISVSRGRPGAPSSRSSSIEPVSNGRIRRQSCSPSRGRAPNGGLHNSGSSMPAVNRLYAKANDNVSPVLMGTKMVDRVMNMRKLAPPKHDDKHSPVGNLSAKSSSPDSSGFGRSMSKKSLDMAIRHMDIRRSIPGNLRPLMTNIPASSMYSVRSGAARSRTISVSDSSPLATSSNGSSELSVSNNGVSFELEDERHGRSPIRGR
ncbi:hypothetical protein LINGRAHAP2_LOCUS1965 [Linum grandiflorum]